LWLKKPHIPKPKTGERHVRQDDQLALERRNASASAEGGRQQSPPAEVLPETPQGSRLAKGGNGGGDAASARHLRLHRRHATRDGRGHEHADARLHRRALS